VEGLALVVHLELAVLWVDRALVELSVPPVIAVLLEVLDLVGYQVLVDLQVQLGPKEGLVQPGLPGLPVPKVLLDLKVPEVPKDLPGLLVQEDRKDLLDLPDQ
jgi:hypothetical protein